MTPDGFLRGKSPRLSVPTTAVGHNTIMLILAVTAAVRHPADGARILALEVVAGKSHWNFMGAVLGALTDSGHHVTAFTPFADGGRENYTEVDVSGDFPRQLDADAAAMIGKFGDARTTLGTVARLARPYCDAIRRNGRLRAILRRGRRGPAADFDAILVEPLWLDCMSRLAAELDVPVVYVVPYALPTFLERSFLGSVPSPATVSHVMARHASVPRTFGQRLANAALLVYSALVFGYYDLWFRYTDSKPYDRYLPVRPSLLFVNSHFITEASRPIHPNVIHIGGIHLTRPKTIPNEILEFIEGSPHGVILFTFGSTVKMFTLPEHIQTAFIEALGQIPQRILWKYEGEMKNKPSNVMIKKWFPQRDILMHPNVKLFISHGGISGVYEAVHAGVPVLGFPLFYDQPRNVANLVDGGMAIAMDLSSVSKDSFLKNVLELVNNEKYAKNAEIASKRFKDLPMTPAQSVVYWTEYVVRHKGASHLNSHAFNSTWYQYFMLDVVGTVLITCLTVLFLIRVILKVIFFMMKSLKKKKMKI